MGGEKASFEDAGKLGLATAGLLNGSGILYVETGKPELGRAAFKDLQLQF